MKEFLRLEFFGSDDPKHKVLKDCLLRMDWFSFGVPTPPIDIEYGFVRAILYLPRFDSSYYYLYNEMETGIYIKVDNKITKEQDLRPIRGYDIPLLYEIIVTMKYYFKNILAQQ